MTKDLPTNVMELPPENSTNPKEEVTPPDVPASDKEEKREDQITTGDEDQQEELTQQQAAKLSGYLEKKGRLRMVSSWKKYWFVLEGRLLLYYRSRVEYDSLSPCKGSITLGAPCTIKPGPASHCVFQIETRNNTIVLRAENRAEQDKWMLAILAALNQTSSTANQARLSHFRYSADDLAVRTPSDKGTRPLLLRQNTLPERLKDGAKNTTTSENGTKASEKPPLPKTIVERLQGLGAQSYVTTASLENIRMCKGSPKLPRNNNLSKLLHKLPPKNVGSPISTPTPSIKGDWIKEDVNEEYGEITENDIYNMVKCEDQETANEGNIEVENNMYIDVQEIALPPEKETDNDKHIYQEINAKQDKPLVESGEYAQVGVDHNKNKVEYDAPKNIYSEPKLPPRPLPSVEKLGGENSAKDEEKSVKIKKQPKLLKEEPRNGSKRQSFVVRMFNKIKKNDNHKEGTKGKGKNKQTVTEVPNPVTSEQTPADKREAGPTVNLELVNELKDVLHVKKHEAHNETQTELKSENLDELEPEISPKPMLANAYYSAENLVADDWIQEDTSLENGSVSKQENSLESSSSPVLNAKNDNQEATISALTSSPLEHQPQLENAQLPPKPIQPDDSTIEVTETESKKLSDFDYDIYGSSKRLNIPRPKLITKPKRQKRLTNSATHKIQFRYQSPKCERKLQNNEEKKLMTIDEILDDLENHNYEPFSRRKVKNLIEKFNEVDTEHESEEDAKNDDQEIRAELCRKRAVRSAELNSLLNELSKVTNAPVSTSEETNSLGVNEPYTQKQWKQIVSARKRRHSDPDYDIPRPHSSLHIIPSIDTEPKMQPTRFFGPVIIENITGDSTSCGTSITPDSLEIDVNNYQAKTYTPSIEEDRSMRSYTSHIYSSNESHLNNANVSHHSHTNQKLPEPEDANQFNATKQPSVDTGDTDKSKEDNETKPTSLSSLIVPKTECEHAFYLNNNNNQINTTNNNNTEDDKNVDKENIIHDDIAEITLINDQKTEKTEEEELTNSMCLDSLEPFVKDAA